MNEQNDNSKSALHDYLTVAIAEDVDLANEYKNILAKNNIPAIATTQRSYSSDVLGIAIMVPESFVEQAQDIIESSQEFDSFLDDAFNDFDEKMSDPDVNFFDDNDNFEDDPY